MSTTTSPSQQSESGSAPRWRLIGPGLVVALFAALGGSAIASAIYEGRVRHRRHAPRAHATTPPDVAPRTAGSVIDRCYCAATVVFCDRFQT